MRTTTHLLRAMALLLAAFLCTSCVMPEGKTPKNDDSSVIILSPDREIPVASDDEIERVSTRTSSSNTSVFSGFPENSILF